MDARRLFFFLGSLFISGYVSWFGQPLIHDNKDAVDIITTVFSILAGFLMTVLTIIIEPKPGAKIWRTDAARRENFYFRIVRYKWLFMLYLIVLGMAFFISLLNKKMADYPLMIQVAEYLFVGFSSLSFIISLTLPNQLIRLQMERYDEMIEEKKH